MKDEEVLLPFSPILIRKSYPYEKTLYGDIFVIETDFLESRVIRPFCKKINGRRYTHVALKTGGKYAESIDLDGRILHDLTDFPYEWRNFSVFRHKEMTDVKREKLKKLNEELPISYDICGILRLGARKLKGMEPDARDLSKEGKSFCTTRDAHMFYLSGLLIKKERDVHWSQIEPMHFFESEFLEKIDEWTGK